jgi:hypothetical protein
VKKRKIAQVMDEWDAKHYSFVPLVLDFLRRADTRTDNDARNSTKDHGLMRRTLTIGLLAACFDTNGVLCLGLAG